MLSTTYPCFTAQDSYRKSRRSIIYLGALGARSHLERAGTRNRVTRLILIGNPFRQTIIDSGQNATSQGHLGHLRSFFLHHPSIKGSQGPGGFGIVLGGFDQDPSEPPGSLLGDPSMVGPGSGLVGGGTQPGIRHQLLGGLETFHISNLGQDEHGRVDADPRDRKKKRNEGILFGLLIEGPCRGLNFIFENLKDSEILIDKNSEALWN